MTTLLAEIKVQWDNLTKFFAAQAIRAKMLSDTFVREFAHNVNEEVQRYKNSTSKAQMWKDVRYCLLQVILDEVDVLIHGSQFLYTTSRIYLRISSTYLSHPLAALSTHLVPGNNADKITAIANLQAEAKTAAEKVNVEVKKFQKEYRAAFNEKIKKFGLEAEKLKSED